MFHLQVTKASSSHWEGKVEAERLQRVYGVSFPEPKQLKEWKHFQEEAAKRDHRKIGECFFCLTCAVISIFEP